MSLGSGIAIAGVWLFCMVCVLSSQVTGAGMVMMVMAALVVTFWVILNER